MGAKGTGRVSFRPETLLFLPVFNDIQYMSEPRIGLFIQARSNSGRLPGKIYAGLPDDESPSILEHIVARLSGIPRVDVLAVLIPSTDFILQEWCLERGIEFVTGPENDVRERYRLAARHFETDLIVRATGDNPCVDPGVAADTIEEMLHRQTDLLSFANLPLGVAVEIFTAAALSDDEIPVREHHREHVTLHIKHSPDRFRVLHLDHPALPAAGEMRLPRLTVDRAEDLIVVRRVFQELGFDFRLADVLELFELWPDFFRDNESVRQRSIRPPVVSG